MSQKNKHNIPIVLMADTHYFPGLIGLLYSFKRNSGLNQDQEIIIFYDEPFYQREEEILRGFGYRVSFRDIREIGNVKDFKLDFYDLADIAPFPWSYMWFKKTLRKLFLFRLEEYKKLVFFDVDMLVMEDITEMFDFEPLSATLEFGHTKPEPKEEYGGKCGICTGFMVFEPKEEYYQEMLKLFNEKPREILIASPTGDQAVINWYFYNHHPEKVHILPQTWGITTRMKDSAPELLSDRPKIVHFLGQKPWFVLEKNDDKFTKMWWNHFLGSGYLLVGTAFREKLQRTKIVAEDSY